MKRLLIIALLLLASTGQAYDIFDNRHLAMSATFGQMAVAGKTASASCDPDTNEVGDRSTQSTNNTVNAGYVVCFKSTADCGGTLSYAYLYHVTTSSEGAKMLVFDRTYDTDNTAAPSASGTRIGSMSDAISGSANNTWYNSGTEIGGTVTLNQKVWVCIATSTTVSWYGRDTTTTYSYYKQVDFYGSEPANMGTGWTIYNSHAPWAAYVKIK